jgi:hypothetical protein
MTSNPTWNFSLILIDSRSGVGSEKVEWYGKSGSRSVITSIKVWFNIQFPIQFLQVVEWVVIKSSDLLENYPKMSEPYNGQNHENAQNLHSKKLFRITNAFYREFYINFGRWLKLSGLLFLILFFEIKSSYQGFHQSN